MGKMKNAIETVYGKNVKYRWLKILGTFAFLVFAYIMIFNFNWNEKDGTVIKASDPAILKGGK